MRKRSDKRTRNGGWLHVDSTETSRSPSPNNSKLCTTFHTQKVEAAPNRKDIIYSALLTEHLSLSEQHREALRARGLSDAEIARNCYRSTPAIGEADTIAAALESHGLQGVAGFYRGLGRWRLVPMAQGILIPVRDSQRRIRGMQIRRDEAAQGGKYIWLSSANRPSGASSGSPIHFSKSGLIPHAQEILITEGGLKGDVCAHLLGVPVIAAAGVNNFGVDFAANLKKRFPHLTKVVIAFDSDFRTKPQVKDALIKLKRSLTHAPFAVSVRVWPSVFKGLDDYLLALRNR
jgi:Domain of unknown function (DUF3854)